jgi:lipopolysaccharide biosynthesis glycosyltransferase
MTNVIVTSVMDLENRSESFKEISSLTLPFFRRYADSCGADLALIEDRKYTSKNNWLNNAFEKIQAIDFLDSYDRVLFIDVDCYISSNCINLFDLVPSDKIGITLKPPEKMKQLNIDSKAAWENITSIPWVAANSGVFLVDQSCKVIKEAITEDIIKVQQGGQSFISSAPAYYDIEYFDFYPYRQSDQINMFFDRKIDTIQDKGILHAMGANLSKIERLNSLINKFETI